MRIESSGHSQGNPRLYELIEHAPKTGKSPTVWAWPELIDYLKIAGQPVAGPWPPHQQPRPDPDYESLPVAVPDPQSGAAQSGAAQSGAESAAPRAADALAPDTQAPDTQAPDTQAPDTQATEAEPSDS
jgi:hypothetical protein